MRAREQDERIDMRPQTDALPTAEVVRRQREGATADRIIATTHRLREVAAASDQPQHKLVMQVLQEGRVKAETRAVLTTGAPY